MNYEELVKALRCDEKCWDNRCQYLESSSYNWCNTKRLCSDAAAAIEDLQAQLPKRGEWELIDEAEPMRWGCSRCKYLSWETSSYCPRCGAKMEVQDDKA